MLKSATTVTASFLFVVLPMYAGVCQNSTTSQSSSDQERLVVLPFETRGLSAEEGLQLRQRFTEVLRESNRFDIMPDNVLKNNLELAGLTKIDSCNTSPCLAQLGNILNIAKIVHVRVDRWENRYILQIRLVNSSDAALLYSERVDFTGEFSTLLSDKMVEQGRKLGAAFLDKPTNWYLIAAAVLVGVGVIYYLFKTFATGGAEPLNNQPIGPAQ